MSQATLEIRRVLQQFQTPLEILTALGGYYECPKDENGKRLGPLVAYRGTYQEGNDRNRFVGDVYANWSAVEQYPKAAMQLAEQLAKLMRNAGMAMGPVTFCGAPEGGKHLADKLALFFQNRYVYPEKGDSDALIWKRHEVFEGDKIIIVEDVPNNFSTADKMIRLIVESGAEVVGIVSYLNRSTTVSNVFEAADGQRIKVVPLVRKVIKQWRQDDLEVSADVEAGNVVWNVKSDWAKLEQAMTQQTTS